MEDKQDALFILRFNDRRSVHASDEQVDVLDATTDNLTFVAQTPAALHHERDK